MKVVASAMHEDGDDAAKFGGSPTDLAERYSIETSDTALEKSNRNTHMAGLLYQLVQQEGWNEAAQPIAKDIFEEELTGQELPDISTPPSRPVWGPLGEEQWGEAYNRALNAMQAMTAYIGRRPAANVEMVEPQPVSANELPAFMKRQPKLDGATTILPMNGPTEILEPKKVKVIWSISIEAQEALEEKMGVLLTLTTLNNPPDLRCASGEEKRDKVRTIFNFEAIKQQFESLVLIRTISRRSGRPRARRNGFRYCNPHARGSPSTGMKQRLE